MDSKLEKLVFKFLDRHFPVNGNEIDCTFDSSPMELVQQLFNITNEVFLVWIESKSKGASDKFYCVYQNGCQTEYIGGKPHSFFIKISRPVIENNY